MSVLAARPESSRGAAVVDDFLALARSGAPLDLGERISTLRTEGLDLFAASGIPTLRQEEWRHTNLGPLNRSRYGEANTELTAEELGSTAYADMHTLVFAGGRFVEALSAPTREGVTVHSLSSLLSGAPADDEVLDQVRERLGQHVPLADHPFAALNTALFTDACVVVIPAHAVIEKPIQLVHLSHGSSSERLEASFPRTLIVAGEASQATVLESYSSVGTGGYLSCPVTEIVCGQSAVVKHYRLLRESLEAFNLGGLFAHLGRDANLASYSLAWGGAIARTDITGWLDGEGIECTFNGLYLATERQLIDHHLRVEHIRPNCSSHELFKGVLDGKARAVFNGRIYVHREAQKTDAKQTNRNLLLSNEALVNSNPQLEIFADDVRCTHGSTIGRLDEEAEFYMRTRGLPPEAARGLMIFAFASEVLDGVEVEALRADLQAHLDDWLSTGIKR